MNIDALVFQVNSDVLSERIRQNEKWGKQRHDLGGRLMILVYHNVY